MQKNLISLQELWRHNTEGSCWFALHGVVYDVTNWLSNHPGGKDLLLASAGRDATQLFEMYHPFIKETEYMKKQLEAFRIGTIRDYDPHYLPDTGFYQETAQRVWKHLREKKIDPKGVQPFLISFLTICSVLLLSYLGTFFLFSSFPLRLLCAVIFGAFSALYEIHPKHDISHGVLVRASPLLHHISSLVDEFFIGGSSWAWLHQHVIGHHVFTNKAGLDPDVPMPSNFFPLPASLPAEPIVPTSQKPAHSEIIFSPEEFRRISPLQPKNSRYYLQHLYVPVLYSAVSLKSRFEDITWTFMGQANGPVSVAPIPVWRWTKLILSKSSYIFLRLVLPLNFAIQQQGGFSVVPLEEIVRTFFSEIIPLFLLSEAIMGWYLALNFQVSHVAEELEWPHPNNEEKDEWAIAQVKASQDWGHGSFIATWFSGALNYQVTHHLFPGLSQYVYPEIAPIILDSCNKFNIPYRVLPGFKEALGSHVGHLKNLSFHYH